MASPLAAVGLALLLLLTRMSLIFSLPSTFTLEVLLRRLQAVNYDSNQWPTYSYTPAAPTRVNVSIFVNSFGAPQASTMDYELDIYLRQQWLDERLRVPGDPDEMLIVSRKNVIDQLWTPDLYFLNLKDAKYHDVTMPNVLMRVYQDGRVFYSIRLKLSLSCQMDLQRYPLDSQHCGIQLATYAHPTSALEFFWSQGTSGGCEGICYSKLEIPQFTLLGVRDMTNITLVYHTGNFSALSASFTLDRQNGYHILQTYIPTMLMVCMSWVSFWLEQTATPARVTLGVTTLLTLTSLAAGVRSELPPVSYLKAIDVWIGTCMIFVFGALLEFVLVHYLAKKRKLQGDRRKSVKEMFFSKEEGESGSSAVPHGPAAGKKQTHILQAKAVDRVCRVVIPLFFLTFNCIYWSMYAQGDE